MCREVATAFDYEFSAQVAQAVFDLHLETHRGVAVGAAVCGSLAAVVGASGTGKPRILSGLGGDREAAGALSCDRGLVVVSQLPPDAEEAAPLVRAASLPFDAFEMILSILDEEVD